MNDFDIVLLICKSYENRLSSDNGIDVFLDGSMFSLPEKQLEALILTEMVKTEIKPITINRVKEIRDLLGLYISKIKF